MVFLFNYVIYENMFKYENILLNYITHVIIICDDRDPPSINNRVKELVNEKKKFFFSMLPP